ncbi:MAG: hypothetical protein PW843_04425 [Azospirillaceae bacterium]|nr:hypothetical protein [Azospirillaceae bacterium]
MDGVDFHALSNLKCYTPAGDAIYAYDGFDCGYTPISKSVNAPTASGSNVIHLSSTSGISVGMSVYDINAGPNTAFSGTVQSIVTNTSVTMTGNWSYPNPIVSGDTLVFGASCGGTGLVIDGDTTLMGGSRYGITLSGGLGGVYIYSLHAYSFASHAIYVDTLSANGIPNREIFLGQFTDIDSNKGAGLYVNNNSIGVLQINGAWIGASGSDAVFIAQQHTTQNPVDTGALVYIANSRISQSNGSCLRYADTGTLVLTGNVMSWCYGAGGDGLSVTSNDSRPKITATGNVFQSNNHYGVYIYGTAPASMVWVGNQWSGNTGGTQAGIVPSANVSCIGNVGGGTGC